VCACVVVGLLVLPVVVVVDVVPSRKSVCHPDTRVSCVNEKERKGRTARYSKIAETNIVVVVVVVVAVAVIVVVAAAASTAAAAAAAAAVVAPTRDSTRTSRAKGIGCSS